MAFGEQVVVLTENGLCSMFMLSDGKWAQDNFSRSGECSGVFHILSKSTFSEKKKYDLNNQ